MDIQITARHSKASADLQARLTDELSALEKFNDKITSCHVILDSENENKTVEITMHVQAHQLSANAKAENLGKAIDEAVAKIEVQLKKIKEKVKEHHNR